MPQGSARKGAVTPRQDLSVPAGKGLHAWTKRYRTVMRPRSVPREELSWAPERSVAVGQYTLAVKLIDHNLLFF